MCLYDLLLVGLVPDARAGKSCIFKQVQYEAWRSGELIQRVMPHLSPVQREVLISGYTTEKQNSLRGFDD